jgi:hypothetical protein
MNIYLFTFTIKDSGMEDLTYITEILPSGEIIYFPPPGSNDIFPATHINKESHFYTHILPNLLNSGYDHSINMEIYLTDKNKDLFP